MKIVLINSECQYIEILNLDSHEQKIMTDYEESDELMDLTLSERVEMILKKRDIEYTDFNPQWMIVDDKLPVFDENHQDEPLCVL